MTIEELEIQLKEMRDEGATDDTEIKFVQYYKGAQIFDCYEVNLYFPETRAPEIEIQLKARLD